jgi:hypothetical protein
LSEVFGFVSTFFVSYLTSDLIHPSTQFRFIPFLPS